ncbi:unnamed protein product [Hymenolepis diminuta]|uniref:G_PROTEIN_RECEP_F1_2 domain-containing protein n=1 Tax=Hymenolepis diminuta TaxID=6216 RepID=A0A0R3SRK4_HYMDI|nr:unnamed protein product [Hymenolepis diminuta]VUZ50365.1 unnamed protein product [Hymenolepis diminuta]
MTTSSEKEVTLITDTTITTATELTSNVSNRADQPELAKNKREYPTPPPQRPGRFRYSLFVITTYVGFGNCAFFCCLPLLAVENIFRGMGYHMPLSLLCAALNVPVATLCMCPCVLTKLRRKFRKKRKIRGSCLMDCFLSFTLFFCVAAQLLTEARGVIIDRKRGTNQDDVEEE